MENAQNTILDRIAREPAYRLAFYRILKFCKTPRSASEVVGEILSFPEMKTAILAPNILLRRLEDVGGVERVIVEEEQERWQTTDAGEKVAELEAPRKRLLELISKEPAHSEIYAQVLGFCQTPRTRTEIEELLKGNPVIVEHGFYPTVFIQRLEDAGGLEWVGKHWRTAEEGKEYWCQGNS